MPKLNELSLQFLKFPGNNLPMRTCNDLYPGISRNFCWLKPWSLSISLSVSISFLLWHCNNKEHLFSLSGVNWGRLLPDYSACTKVWNTKLCWAYSLSDSLVRHLLPCGSVSMYSDPKPRPHWTECPQNHLPLLTGALQRCQGRFLTCYTLLVTCKFSSLLFWWCFISNINE